MRSPASLHPTHAWLMSRSSMVRATRRSSGSSTLEPGQSAIFTFDLDDLNGGGKQFDNPGGNPGIFTEQATVQDTCGNNANCDATLCSVNQAVEIVNSRTGVTRVLVDGLVQEAASAF